MNALNPIISAASQNRLTTFLNPIKKIFQAVKAAQNPNAALGQLMQNNPQYAEAMRIIKENGGDAKKAFYALAQQNGVDPEEIIKQFK